MLKYAVIICLIVFTISACGPATQNGFYSDKFTQQQVVEAAQKGKVKKLDSFYIEPGGCGFYKGETITKELLIPSIQAQLKQMNANAAENIFIQEQWYDIPLGIFILPAAMGCSNWVVKGDALLVEME
ncbi:MAG TPA: hypothetical protein PK864_02285 [Syntrophorhabdaceae bacterium]|nr:hypothetical protein [Syntrophorhabdaceae bacterium]HON84839.1 hypothetical protein [Syntrophorhabdaceae bacterium]HPC66417.1 hypothetical protein [Syntrophorhabdaceae bacterium]HPP41059.1 hypothetical protein [Syntrophorhabdaceae bacterium]HQH43302.1 hypothetical protein [Syntrophorhabdaceae bacterium]